MRNDERAERGPVTIELVVLPAHHQQWVNREPADVHRDPDASPPRLTVCGSVPPAVVGAQVLEFAEHCRRRDAAEAVDTPDRLTEAAVLSNLVYAALPPAHPVCQAFRQLDAEYELDDDEDNDGIPSPATVQAALDAFYGGLSEAAQRRLLNGWRPCPDRPTRAELRRLDPGDVDRVVELFATADGVRSQAGFVLDSLAATVRVRIQEGTSRERALRELRAIAVKLAAEWETVVDAPARREEGDRREVA